MASERLGLPHGNKDWYHCSYCCLTLFECMVQGRGGPVTSVQHACWLKPLVMYLLDCFNLTHSSCDVHKCTFSFCGLRLLLCSVHVLIIIMHMQLLTSCTYMQLLTCPALTCNYSHVLQMHALAQACPPAFPLALSEESTNQRQLGVCMYVHSLKNPLIVTTVRK